MYSENEINVWNKIYDWIPNADTFARAIQHTVLPDSTLSEWIFVKSSCSVQSVVNHWILWNSIADIVHDARINVLLETALREIVGSDDFDFVWYMNANMVYHVFWIRC